MTPPADPRRCSVPPDGWWCSREVGHEGPCAARPAADPRAPEPQELIARIENAGAFLRACMMKPAPGFDTTDYGVFRDSPALSSIADVLYEAAEALATVTRERDDLRAGNLRLT